MSALAEESSPRRSPVRRWLVPGLAMLAVAGIATGAVVVVHRSSGSGDPPPLNLVGSAVGSAADSSAGGSGVGTVTGQGNVAAPQLSQLMGQPKVAGPLPAGPSREKVRTLPSGAAPAGTVAALARALGLSGTPSRSTNGWQLTDGDRVFAVNDGPGMNWYLAGKGAGMSCHVISSKLGRLCRPGMPVPGPLPRSGSVPGSSGQGSSGQGSSGQGSSGSSGSGGGPVVSRPGAPANDGKAAGKPAPRGPNGAATAVPVPIPVDPLPVPSRPTDAEALAAARPVLAALGQSGAATRVVRLAGYVSVEADPVVDGLPTSGYATSLQLSPGGAVVGGHGWLARPAAGASYPLVPAAEALRQIAVPDIARVCGTKVCELPAMVVTGARLGLALRYSGTGQALLVPAWFYAVRGSPYPMVLVAVQPKYLGVPSGRPNVPGGGAGPGVVVDPKGGNQHNGGAVPPDAPTSTPTR